MKYLKYSLRLLVPFVTFAGLIILISNISWQLSDYPVFAGTAQYLKMLFEPDIFPMILRNNIPYCLVTVYCAAVLFTLYGLLREKLSRVKEIAAYCIVWLVSFVSTVYALTLLGRLDSKGYPSFTIVLSPSEYQGIKWLYSALLAGVFTSVAVFIVWVVYRLILRLKASDKPQKNSMSLLSVGTALMGTYMLFYFVNGLLRTLLLLDAEGMLTSKLRTILNANWLSVAAFVVAVILLIRLSKGKQPAKGLFISLIVLSSLVLLRGLVIGNAFNSVMVSGFSLLEIASLFVYRLFSTLAGVFLDVIASVVLIVASVRLMLRPADEQTPKKNVLSVLSKALLVLGVVVLAIWVSLVVFTAFITFNDGGGSIGIIGGSDMPTFWFVLTQTIKGYTSYLISCLLVIAVSVVLKIVLKKKKAEA